MQSRLSKKINKYNKTIAAFRHKIRQGIRKQMLLEVIRLNAKYVYCLCFNFVFKPLRSKILAFTHCVNLLALTHHLFIIIIASSLH